MLADQQMSLARLPVDLQAAPCGINRFMAV